MTAEQMRTEFARQGRYMAGLATKYRPSALTADSDHQGLAAGFEIGTRFHSAPVVRVADGKHMQLGHVHRADGRWRLYAFGDESGAALIDLAAWLSDSSDSPVRRFTPEGRDVDDVLDVHAVFQSDHHAVDLGRMPEILLPHSGPLGLQDWEKIWAVDASRDIFDERSVSREGAIVIVRPDQYVAHVLPLHARGEIADFFAGILVDRSPAVVR